MTPTDPNLQEELEKEAARHLRAIALKKKLEGEHLQAEIADGAADKLEAEDE